jgi:hypothetical protein
MPEGLGRLYNIGSVTVPTDAVAGAITGQRNNLRDYGGVDFLVVTSGGSTDITDVDLRQHTASTGGTSADLDVIDHYYYRTEATVDGDEVWIRGTQSAASEITDVGAASQELVLVICVEAEQLSDGYTHVSLDIPDLGTNGTRFCTIIPILRDPMVQRAPAALAVPLT